MSYLASADRYQSMTYKRCGRSGVHLPPISLGLWDNFGGVDTFENGRAIVRHAFDAGVIHFDLANNYGPPPGSAEENFGKMIKLDLHPYRDELVISTKAGYLMWPGPYGEWGSKKYLWASLNQSLKRMGLEYVDIFYSHRYDPQTPLEETMSALDLAVRQGKALYVGISNYPAEQTKQVATILRQLGTPCLIHQPKYSLFERWIEDGLTEVLRQEGIGCIAFSPLAQGLLSDKYLTGIPADSRAAKPHGFLRPAEITEQKLSQVAALNELAKKREQTLAQMALAWVLRLPEVTSALIGVKNQQQLDENLNGLQNLHFSPAELQAIDAITKSS